MAFSKFTPTSKKLTWTITVFYILLMFAVGAVDVIFHVKLQYLLGYVLPLESIIVVAYFSKSGMEHYVEIKNQTSQYAPQVIGNESETNQGGEV